MRQIFKYPLAIVGEQVLLLPKGAEILHIGVQNGELYLWAMVDEQEESEIRRFSIIGTGHSIPERVSKNLYHIGTVFMSGGSLVWHVFEEIKG